MQFLVDYALLGYMRIGMSPLELYHLKRCLAPNLTYVQQKGKLAEYQRTLWDTFEKPHKSRFAK